MPGQQQVDPTLRHRAHGAGSAHHQIARAMVRRQIKWMVRHQNLRDPHRNALEMSPNARQLLAIDAAIFPDPRPRGIDPERGDFLVAEAGMQFGRDVAPIIGEPAVYRHVMISRHHDLRAPKLIQKLPRLLKLRRSRALRQVSRNHHQVRFDVRHCLQQRRAQSLIETAKMYVREMQQSSHGTITFKLSGNSR